MQTFRGTEGAKHRRPRHATHETRVLAPPRRRSRSCSAPPPEDRLRAGAAAAVVGCGKTTEGNGSEMCVLRCMHSAEHKAKSGQCVRNGGICPNKRWLRHVNGWNISISKVPEHKHDPVGNKQTCSCLPALLERPVKETNGNVLVRLYHASQALHHCRASPIGNNRPSNRGNPLPTVRKRPESLTYRPLSTP